MQWMPRAFVQWASVTAEKTAAKEAYARAERGDIWSCQQQDPARLEDAVDLSQERKVVFQMFDAFRGHHRVETSVRPGKRSIEVGLNKRRSKALTCTEIDVCSDSVEAAFTESKSQRSGGAAGRVENAGTRRQLECRKVVQHRALNHGKLRVNRGRLAFRGGHGACRFVRTSS